MDAQYTTIVVGAGSCGAVVAERLSANGNESVLLLDAGRVYRSRAEFPRELLDPSVMSASLPGHPHNWDLTGELTPGQTWPIPRGRGIGGSSSINGTYFIRGTKDDFEHWKKLGNDEWGWNEVLPYFCEIETDYDFDGPIHGASGPVPVRRVGKERAPDFDHAFTSACSELGFAPEPDKNNGGSGGYGPVPFNVQDGARMGTGLTHLLPAMNRRSLTVVGNAFVRRLLFEGPRAVGVEVGVEGKRTHYRAERVVVAAGALRSPHLLMVSGVGPADKLRALGIDVVADLPGVGQNLVDHPELTVSYRVSCPLPELPGYPNMTSSLNWSSGTSSTPHSTDLEILPMVRRMGSTMKWTDGLLRPIKTLKALYGTSMQAIRNQVMARGHPFVVVGVMQEDSRGEVTLVAAEPEMNPRIAYNFLGNENDRRRFRQAAQVLQGLFDTSAMRAIKAEVFNLPRVLARGDDAVDEWVRRRLFIAGHPSCTCRMGLADDKMAVVDQRASVYGVEGLRVVDTSSFPHIPSRGPNATAIMFADRIASFMLVEGT